VYSVGAERHREGQRKKGEVTEEVGEKVKEEETSADPLFVHICIYMYVHAYIDI